MIGTRIGNWILTSELGTGSLGTVYKAANADVSSPNDPTVAAVKVLSHPLSRDPAFQARFPSEMLGLRRLTHPNIARLYDSGVHAGLAYYATEFVEGTDVATMLARHEKSPDQPGLGWQSHFFRIAIQTARALKHAHHRSILHRELKPGNLIVTADGSLKVTDFGVAKVFNQPPLTLPAEPMGTAGYLAPEHFTGKPLTRRSDLYALGGVLYTVLTGRPPFVAATAAEFMHKHCYTLPDRPANFIPKLPHEIDDFVCALLAKDPSRRPASAAAILDDLDQIRGKLERKGAKVLPPPSADDPTGLHAPLTEVPAAVEIADTSRTDRRAKQLRALVLGLSFLLVVGTILFVFFRPHPPAETLWTAAQPLVESQNPDDWDRATEEFLGPLSSWYPAWNPDEVRVAKQILAERKELARSFSSLGKAKYTSEAERLYHRGQKLVQVGDYGEARRTWEALARVFGSSEVERRWVSLAKFALAELAKHPGPRANITAVAEAVAQARKLRQTGQNAEADAMLKAIEELYRDQPDVLELVRSAK
ncbi:serine/threonine protein kinase [Limnoglobus roseus]|uniref:Serine/threonine protein kinase n=1 Tax=Limnoglobus roseus TaxID=2598579 RepID=A0A5C1ABF1_9BACT|nr:serine/threonine-protein kinase [Limnoglobus roseus]QEL15346.1 serine/threonine protein kinase [Limnoglobus roseus]